MRIVVVNETSTADRNSDILAALDGRAHEIVNAGMTSEITHRPMGEIVRSLPSRVLGPALHYPGVWEQLDVGTLTDRVLAAALLDRYTNG